MDQQLSRGMRVDEHAVGKEAKDSEGSSHPLSSLLIFLVICVCIVNGTRMGKEVSSFAYMVGYHALLPLTPFVCLFVCLVLGQAAKNLGCVSRPEGDLSLVCPAVPPL